MPYLNQNPQKQHFSVATQSFTASDGYTLFGTLYTPEHGIKANIVVACATGVPQAFIVALLNMPHSLAIKC